MPLRLVEGSTLCGTWVRTGCELPISCECQCCVEHCNCAKPPEAPRAPEQEVCAGCGEAHPSGAFELRSNCRPDPRMAELEDRVGEYSQKILALQNKLDFQENQQANRLAELLAAARAMTMYLPTSLAEERYVRLRTAVAAFDELNSTHTRLGITKK
jgi:hypothetical protein